MSYIFHDCAGTIHAFSTGGSAGGVGLFSLRPSISVPSGSKCLLDSVPVDFREVVYPVVTLDDSRFVYTFGSAWTESGIQGRLLLGKMGNGGAAIRSLVSWYQRNRISVLRKPIQASAGQLPLNAYVTGMRVGDADPSLHIVPFTITTLVDAEP